MCYRMHCVCGSVFLVAGFVPKKGFPAPKVFSRSVCVCGCCVFVCGCVCTGGGQRAQ